MIAEDYKNLFCIFLLKNKIYKRYFEGVSEYLACHHYLVEPVYCDKNRVYDYICNAFSWHDENFNHEEKINWEAMHNNWVNIITKYKKQCRTH